MDSETNSCVQSIIKTGPSWSHDVKTGPVMIDTKLWRSYVEANIFGIFRPCPNVKIGTIQCI